VNVFVSVTLQPTRAPPTFQAWRSARMGNDWHPAARMEQSGFGRLAIEKNNNRSGNRQLHQRLWVVSGFSGFSLLLTRHNSGSLRTGKWANQSGGEATNVRNPAEICTERD
jgi:hypothetical protein